jgi:large repetitive protein
MTVATIVRAAGAATLAFGLITVGTVSAGAAEPPETELVTYSWSHTAHLASFNFAASDPLATYECSLTAPDQAPAWTGCSGRSSTQYSALAVGDYLFRVRARTADGVDPTPAWRVFNIGVDAIAPETTLTTTAKTTSRDATFTFTATEPGTFECLLRTNGKQTSGYTPCTSPVVYEGLGDATYEFTVRAVDLHGEYDRDGARHTWLLDATPPETLFYTPTVEGSSASFPFGSAEGAAQCRLTGPSRAHGWRDCASPTKYTGLVPGRYVWAVRAYDRHGNVDQTPAAHTWQVLPTTGRVGGTRTVQQGRTARFTLSSPHQGATFQCKLDAGPWKSCGSPHKVRTDNLKASKSGVTHVLLARARVNGLTDTTPASKEFRVIS